MVLLKQLNIAQKAFRTLGCIWQFLLPCIETAALNSHFFAKQIYRKFSGKLKNYLVFSCPYRITEPSPFTSYPFLTVLHWFWPLPTHESTLLCSWIYILHNLVQPHFKSFCGFQNHCVYCVFHGNLLFTFRSFFVQWCIFIVCLLYVICSKKHPPLCPKLVYHFSKAWL